MIVLTYHKILNSLSFEKQVQYVIKKYNIDQNFQEGSYGPKKLLITVDDGDFSFYQNAFPILKKYNIPATLFVITSLINTQKPFWWDEIEYYLGEKKGKLKVWEVKSWPNTKREIYLNDLRTKSTKPELVKQQLTIAQLQEMQSAGIIIANHSHTHPMFDQCTIQELEEEMALSTNFLKELGFSERIFAYPNGNYSSKSEAVLKTFGITTAYLFNHKINAENIHPLRISRLIVNDGIPMWKFKFILSGWHSRILPITRFVGKLKGKFK